MTRKRNRLDELFDAEIDYSMPIDRFAQKVKALINRLARETKQPCYTRGYSDSAEYGDGSARVYIDANFTADFFKLVDTKIRELVKTHEVSKAPLNLSIVGITLKAYELNVTFI